MTFIDYNINPGDRGTQTNQIGLAKNLPTTNFNSVQDFVQKIHVYRKPLNLNVDPAGANFVLLDSTTFPALAVDRLSTINVTNANQGGLIAAAIEPFVPTPTGLRTNTYGQVFNIALVVDSISQEAKRVDTGIPDAEGNTLRTVFALMQAGNGAADNGPVGGLGAENLMATFVYRDETVNGFVLANVTGQVDLIVPIAISNHHDAVIMDPANFLGLPSFITSTTKSEKTTFTIDTEITSDSSETFNIITGLGSIAGSSTITPGLISVTDLGATALDFQQSDIRIVVNGIEHMKSGPLATVFRVSSTELAFFNLPRNQKLYVGDVLEITKQVTV